MIKKSYWQKVDDSDHTDSRSVYDKLGDEYHNLKRENAELQARITELERAFDIQTKAVRDYEFKLMHSRSESQIKADAILDAVNYGIEKSNKITDDEHRFGAKSILLVIEAYANKLRRGES